MQVQSLNREDPLEEDMATHSSILAWRVPWTEKPGRLQSTGLQTDTTEATQLTLTHGQCQMVELCLKNKLRLYFKYHTQQAVSFFLSAYFLSSPTPSLLPFFFFLLYLTKKEKKMREKEKEETAERERKEEKKGRRGGGEKRKKEAQVPAPGASTCMWESQPSLPWFQHVSCMFPVGHCCMVPIRH